MKDNHIYQRMSNHRIVQHYVCLIQTKEIDIAIELYNNIKNEASDHQKFHLIQTAYNKRMGLTII